MITADTITDEQIRELRGTAAPTDAHTNRACNQALHAGNARTRLRARARCAEILNERANAVSS